MVGSLGSWRVLTSPKKLFRLIGFLAVCLTVIRIVVLFCESWSTVYGERLADVDLLHMCDSGAASDSQDFRALCLRKRSERAAPVLLKAILRACRTAFQDFLDVFSSPTRIAILLLFVVTGVAAPVVRVMSVLTISYIKRQRKLLPGGSDSDSDDERPTSATGIVPQIVTARPISATVRRRMSRWKRQANPARLLRIATSPQLEEITEDDDDAIDNYGYSVNGFQPLSLSR